jgi:hypothetical protein
LWLRKQYVSFNFVFVYGSDLDLKATMITTARYIAGTVIDIWNETNNFKM